MRHLAPVLLTLSGGCAAGGVADLAPPTDAPYVLVLGTAQDAGLPQLGCPGPHCERARNDPEARRYVTSLLLADPRTGERWLFDCTPDIREQAALARGHPSTRALPGPRPPLFEGVFLTHAHMGHYAGLLHFGPEAYGARELPVHASPRFAEFLRTSGPWSLLVEGRNLELRPFPLEEGVALAPDLRVRAMRVPHRDELSDTLAFVIEGPHRSLLYLPDIDKWERWDTPIEDVVAQVDHALLDGAFFSADEIPGRSIADIPHPLIQESLVRFSRLRAAERRKVVFTHLNHTNPAGDPHSAEAAAVREAGFAVAREGTIFRL